jgi:hypothetical protein
VSVHGQSRPKRSAFSATHVRCSPKKTGSRRSCEMLAVVIVGGCDVMESAKSGRAQSHPNAGACGLGQRKKTYFATYARENGLNFAASFHARKKSLVGRGSTRQRLYAERYDSDPAGSRQKCQIQRTLAARRIRAPESCRYPTMRLDNHELSLLVPPEATFVDRDRSLATLRDE